MDKKELDEHFPEFEYISKTAMDKWLNHLINNGKLLRKGRKNILITKWLLQLN